VHQSPTISNKGESKLGRESKDHHEMATNSRNNYTTACQKLQNKFSFKNNKVINDEVCDNAYNDVSFAVDIDNTVLHINNW